MAGAVFLGTLIAGLVMPPIPESPCPDVFRYHVQPLGDDSVTITGLVTVTDPPKEPLHLFVHLQLRAILPSKYVGLVEFIEQNNITSKNPLKQMYRVRFPLFKPLPTVRLITVNSYSICSGSPVSGPVVTDIRLEHSLWPRHLINHTTDFQSQNQDATEIPAQLATAPFNLEPEEQCGQASPANPLLVGGRQLRPGEWPWLVAIFVLNSLGLEFHCSGTIISKMFVLTVGHCMRHEEAGTMDPSDVVVYVGKHNLQLWEEPYSAIKEVSMIHIHPEFDPNKFSADIALLHLKTPIKYSKFVQPVCLWSQTPDLEFVVGQFGTVVGWGRDGSANRMSPTPRVIEIPIVSTEECIKSHNEFVFLTSSSTLCAGSKDGNGPCNGDSGGGLMLPVKWKNVTRWELRGIVSLSLLNTKTQSCDLSQYVVFTDTAKFLPWISYVVNKSS